MEADAQPSRRSRVGLELPDDRFIPVHSQDLVAAIRAQPERFPRIAGAIDELAAEIDHVIAQETTAFERFIVRRYDTVNPARDTKAVEPPASDESLDELQQMIGYLLEKANYERLEAGEIEATINAAKSHGMRIRTDPERLERLELYVRGQTTDEQRRRTLRAPIRGRKHTVEVFRRLVVVFQFKGDASLNLKLFRDIPVADVEALLPHAVAAMSTLDRVKIALGAAGAFGGIAWKAVTGTAIVGQLMWAWIVAFFGLSVRAFLGFRRSRRHRDSQMTHNLYYRIVANNAGVLGLLLGSLGQEEVKEAILGYTLLLHDPSIGGEDDLELAASAWLDETFDVVVDFDAADAIATLDRLGLLDDVVTLEPIAPDRARVHLFEHWRDGRTKEHHRVEWSTARTIAVDRRQPSSVATGELGPQPTRDRPRSESA